MTFKLEIEMGTDAMQTAFHVAHALMREVVPTLKAYYRPSSPDGPREFNAGTKGVIHDIEGKRVGSWEAS